MSNEYPFYTEQTHTRGTVTVDANNGARTTTTSNTEGRLIVEVSDRIALLEPNRHSLVTLFTNVGKTWDGKSWKGSSVMKKSSGNPTFGWFDDYYPGKYAKVAAAYTAGAGSVDVTGAGASPAYIFTVGDVVKNQRTGENMLVTAITDANTLAMSHAFGTTAQAAGVAGDELFIIGNVSEEGASARNTNTTQISKTENYTQIFKKSFIVTGTEKEANLYGGRDLPYLRAKVGTEHNIDIERAMWFGEKYADTSGTQGHPRRETGGVNELIQGGSAYVQSQGGPISAPDLNTFLREAFTYGSARKTLFAGGIVLQAINEMARGQLQTKPMDTSYGMKISTWVTPFGEINIVHNPLFVGEYAGWAFLLDLECFMLVTMNNRDTKLFTNVQGNDVDAEVDQYVTECGLERRQPARHALLKGVTN